MEGGECALCFLCKRGTSSSLRLCTAEVSHGTVRTLQQLLVASPPPSAISKGRAKPALCADATHGKIAGGWVGEAEMFLLWFPPGTCFIHLVWLEAQNIGHQLAVHQQSAFVMVLQAVLSVLLTRDHFFKAGLCPGAVVDIA